MHSISQGKDSSSFEEVWPAMRPIVLKVLKQEPVSQSEWQDLFYGVHLVCLWDEKGATKIYDCLQEDIVTFIKQAQTRVLAQREEQALLKAYIIEWRKFFTQSSYLPLPFRQLETGLLVSYFVNTSGSAYHKIYVFFVVVVLSTRVATPYHRRMLAPQPAPALPAVVRQRQARRPPVVHRQRATAVLVSNRRRKAPAVTRRVWFAN